MPDPSLSAGASGAPIDRVILLYGQLQVLAHGTICTLVCVVIFPPPRVGVILEHASLQDVCRAVCRMYQGMNYFGRTPA